MLGDAQVAFGSGVVMEHAGSAHNCRILRDIAHRLAEDAASF
jgi:hypothetical protein